MKGRYYSSYYETGSAVGGEDLVTKVKDDLNLDQITIEKLILISPCPVSVDINNLGVYSPLRINADNEYVLSLNNGDCVVSSLKIEDTSASNLYLSIIF